jgi:hypothetical protein
MKQKDRPSYQAWYAANRKRLIAKATERNKRIADERRVYCRDYYHKTKTTESMETRAQAQHRRYWADPAKARAVATNYRRALRHEFLTEYGGKCACCGETEFAFLTLEHIFRDGNVERKQFSTTHQLLRQLKKQGWPKDRYEILCFNCNRATHELGVCPHRRNTE